MFSYVFWKISKNIFFTEHLRTTASAVNLEIKSRPGLMLTPLMLTLTLTLTPPLIETHYAEHYTEMYGNWSVDLTLPQ